MAAKRFAFLLLCVLILLICPFGHAQSPVQKIYKWKVASVYPANVPIFNNGIEKFAQDIKTEVKGLIDIQVYAAGQMIEDINKSIKSAEVFDAVSDGTVEIGFGARLWSDKIPSQYLCILLWS
jgi:TRAP-type mannitol/chloroaromatic compound transport system substrate-binding protein